MDEYFIEEKSSLDTLLDFLVFVAVLVVTIFLILDILGQAGSSGVEPGALDGIYLWVNIIVFVIFFADLVRLWGRSAGAKDFFAHNWLDVLATIPFELLALGLAAIPPETAASLGIVKWFRFTKLARASRLQKVSRVSKVSKEFKAAAHLKKEGDEYKKKHRL